MKAIIYEEYGGPEVLKLTEVKKPIPKDNELLIKVYATTATTAECMMRRGDALMTRIILGFRKPKEKYQIMGLELAGEIVSIGKKVTRFKVGDMVYGFTGFTPGAYAEYKCIDEKSSLALMPENMTYEEAASIVDGATTSLYFLKDKAGIKKGQKVLINGASGSIGTAAVQLAKYYGAHVTGVCSGKNVELVKSLGADKVIDYTKQDFTATDEKYDIVFDTVSKSNYFSCRKILKKNGSYLLTVAVLRHYILMLLTKIFRCKKLICGMSIEKTESLNLLRRLIESENIKPVIDRRYTLEQLSEAHGYVDTGHKRGNVSISVCNAL